MGKIMNVFSAAARAEREAIEAAQRPVGCTRCGMTFGSPSAHTIAHDGRCLPPSAYGQLVEVDGVWCTRADAARR